ncbi:venom protease-like [Achroia grisella]|uniref:venom protease-like n=1 Tax=Achroia grisella TaxID=688607 RepID=UPI0027D1EDE0|nr:venom protease-like [Achroia grisella]
MWSELIYFSFVCVIINGETLDLVEGDRCNAGNGIMASCTHISNCREAVKASKIGNPFKICSYVGKDPIVCCLKPELPVDQGNRKDNCDFSKYNGIQIGKKAMTKCLAYQHQLCPCETHRVTRDIESVNVPEVSDGVDSKLNEFPNMALLGYGPDFTTAEWLCGGSIISNRFILTAGHCIRSRNSGSVSFVALGLLARSDLKQDLIYNVKRIIIHPDYKPPVKYNDIALLETDRKITFSQRVQPACLHVDSSDDEGLPRTTVGWGAQGYTGNNANILQKTELFKFSEEECFSKFHITRLLRNGINHTTQVCYGHRKRPRDTCQGDSGGPLLIRNNIQCLHSIIGVTSFGYACGLPGLPGVYTKILPYLPWIESVVWSEEE